MLFKTSVPTSKCISTLFKSIKQGFAYHKIIVDDNNKPVDYIYLDVNESFEVLTGFKKDEIINRRASEVFPGIENNKINLIKLYGEIAQKGTNERIEKYFASIHRWFNIIVFSPEQGFFITLLDDITEQKEKEKWYKKVSEEYAHLNKRYITQNNELVNLLGELNKKKDDIQVSLHEINKHKIEIQKNETQLKSILDSTDNGVLVINEKGNVIFSNERFFDMWKVPQNIRDTKDDKRLLDSILEQLENPKDFIKKVNALYGSDKEDFEVIRFKDKRKFERFSKALINADKITGRVWSFRDVTQKYNRERELEFLNNILSTLRNINKIQATATNKKTLIEDVCNCIKNSIGISCIMINIFENDKFSCGYQVGFKSNYNLFIELLKSGKHFNCMKKRTSGNILRIKNIKKECDECPLVDQYKNNFILSIPVVHKATKYGYLNVNVSEDYSENYEIQDFLKEVSDELALSLFKLDLEEKTERYNNQLKIREKGLRSIFKSSPVGIGVENNRMILEVNEKFCEIVGYNREELIGQSTKFLFISEHHFEIFGNDKSYQLRKYGTSNVETKLRRKDGEIIDVLINSTPFDTKDWTKGITFSAQDITESKQNAKIKDILLAINQESNKTDDIDTLAPKIQKELSKLFDTENFYIATYNEQIEEYSFLYFKDKFKINQYNEGSYILKDSIIDYVRANKNALLINKVLEKELINKNKIKKYREYSSVGVAAPLINAKGRSFGIIAVQNYDNYDAYSDEDVVFLDYVAQNISKIIEKIQAEKALKKSEEEYRMLFENQGEGIAKVDMQENIMVINPAGAKIFGLSEHELIGRNLSEFMDAEQFIIVREETAKRKQKVRSTYELKLDRPDGQKKYLLITVTPLVSNGKVTGNLGIFRDITEYKKTELYIKLKNEELQAAEEELTATNDELQWVNKELEKNNIELLIAKEKAESADKLKSAFLANMSHEIRTPMNSILGFAELLKNKQLNKVKQEHFIDIINSNGRQLITIIDDIIDFSKIEANQIELYFERINLIQILDDIYQTFLTKIHLENLNIKLELIKPNIQEFYFKTDETRLKQVIINLLGNAIKFTKEGTITLSCEFKGNDQLLFSVKDEGIGIPQDKLKIIFERFRQVDDSTTRKFGGTGLGLTISKSLVNLLGGNLKAESKVGEGAQFYFNIPIKEL